VSRQHNPQMPFVQSIPTPPRPQSRPKISVLCSPAIPPTPAASQSSAASHQTSAVSDDSLLAATCASSKPDPRQFIGHWIGSLPKLREYEEVPGVSTGDCGTGLSTLVTHAHIRSARNRENGGNIGFLYDHLAGLPPACRLPQFRYGYGHFNRRRESRGDPEPVTARVSWPAIPRWTDLPSKR
jgi:hypothetical protein